MSSAASPANEITLDPEHAERFYAENPGAADRAMRERHRLNARSIQLQRFSRRASVGTAAPAAVSVPRATARPRERREARHQARSTSSGDSGSDSDEPEPPKRRLTVYTYGFVEAVA